MKTETKKKLKFKVKKIYSHIKFEVKDQIIPILIQAIIFAGVFKLIL